MKVYVCSKCEMKMVPNPLSYKYTNLFAGGERGRNYFCGKCSDDKPVHWFLDYNEYMQKKSIEAWK